MTVGELKAKLADVDDRAIVFVGDFKGGAFIAADSAAIRLRSTVGTRTDWTYRPDFDNKHNGVEAFVIASDELLLDPKYRKRDPNTPV